MDFNLFNSIILAGIIQGLVFGVVVLTNKKYRAAATIFLGCLILSFSLDNLQYYLVDIGLISEMQLLKYYFVPFLLLPGALFLLYGLHLLKPERNFSRRDWLYFLPFGIAFVAALTIKILSIFKIADLSMQFLWDFEELLEYAGILYDLIVICFLLARMQVEPLSTRELRPEINWFRRLLIFFTALLIVWVFVAIADYAYGENIWYLLYIGMSVSVYWMGYVGIQKYGVYQERKKIRSYSVMMAPAAPSTKPINEYVNKLKDLLQEQKRFLDPTISLEQAADEIGVSKSHLSRLINSELGAGFNDYLNTLRVEEAKRYLENPEFAQYTLVAIGLEAGFNSKTTFNTAFKKIAGVTPSEYRKSLYES